MPGLRLGSFELATRVEGVANGANTKKVGTKRWNEAGANEADAATACTFVAGTVTAGA